MSAENFEIHLNKKRNRRSRTASNKNAFFIEGGGTKGVYAVGILKYLFGENQYYPMQKTDIFGGTSVGSYLATPLSLAFNADDITAISKIINISNVIDSKFLFGLTAYRFITQGHLYSERGIQKIVESILNYKINIINDHLAIPDTFIKGKDLTFGHLRTLINKYPSVYKHLLINAVDINRSNQIFMTTMDEKWNNIKLFDAMMASSAIPYVFKPIILYYDTKTDQYGYTKSDGLLECQLVDGGVSTNNPLDYFLVNKKKYADFDLWLLKFTTKPQYVKINGVISLLKQLVDYLIRGKNDVKMELVQDQYDISTINLYSSAGTFDSYTEDQIQKIINDIYNQCSTGKLHFGN